MKKILYILMLVSYAAMANMDKAPPSFQFKDSTAVYVDFQEASYDLNYDFDKQSLVVTTQIILKQNTDGHIIFDLVSDATSFKLDGEVINASVVRAPSSASSYRIAQKKTTAGIHILDVTNVVTKNVSFTTSGVSSAFWMSDLNDRRYLESYVPTNLEFDQYKMTFTVNFNNFPKQQKMFANGQVVEVSRNKFIISYPDYYTASSLYYHTAHEDRFDIVESTFKSIDGREIPVTIYRTKGSSISSFSRETPKILNELESNFGPFPHQKIVIYGAGQGGMEYCGATMTSLSALGHELTHSYYARGIMPARGNSGWVDEAIASWRDSGYPSRRSTGFRSTQMAGHSVYRRFTDRDAYGRGAKFMAYLNYLLADQGGLKPFIKKFKDAWLFKPFFTIDFQTALETHMNRSLSSEFNQYVYGLGGIEKNHKVLENPNHPVLSDEYIFSLL
jgi:hypothetical protein